MEEILESFSESHCYAYIFVTAGFADGHFSEEEKRLLKVRVGNEVYAEVTELYQAMTAEEREELLDVILGTHFSRPEEQENLLRGLRQMFMADGVYSEGETALLQRLKLKLATIKA